MPRRFKTLRFPVMALLLLFAVVAVQAAEPVHISLIAINDFHGNIQPPAGSVLMPDDIVASWLSQSATAEILSRQENLCLLTLFGRGFRHHPDLAKQVANNLGSQIKICLWHSRDDRVLIGVPQTQRNQAVAALHELIVAQDHTPLFFPGHSRPTPSCNIVDQHL